MRFRIMNNSIDCNTYFRELFVRKSRIDYVLIIRSPYIFRNYFLNILEKNDLILAKNNAPV